MPPIEKKDKTNHHSPVSNRSQFACQHWVLRLFSLLNKINEFACFIMPFRSAVGDLGMQSANNDCASL